MTSARVESTPGNNPLNKTNVPDKKPGVGGGNGIAKCNGSENVTNKSIFSVVFLLFI